MLQAPIHIPASPAFWDEVASVLLKHAALSQHTDLSGLCVVVPAHTQGQLLKAALLKRIGTAFVAPQIVTLSDWCALLPPEADAPTAANARLMMLYAELRQHGWLKKLFSARRNTDLLPLAQVILGLCDELTRSLLPSVWRGADDMPQRWQKAMEQLSPAARAIVSDEAQLVWSIWKTQIDGSDTQVQRYRQMMQLANQAQEPMVWIAPAAGEAFEQGFLQAYGERRAVLPVFLDWRPEAVCPSIASAWPELQGNESPQLPAPSDLAAPPGVALCPARSMEQEAQFGAQTIVDWLHAGRQEIAVVAQDRIVARRLRALLERAQVFVADETGWKLSTTRAASAIAAWFDVVASRAETIALLDLLKSPFMFADRSDKPAQLMTIEATLRNANVAGGWETAVHALAAAPAAQAWLIDIARQANRYGGRKTIAQWSAVTEAALQGFGMWAALQDDAAGCQVVALLQAIVGECEGQAQVFSFAEWRAFVSLRMEETAYMAPGADRRVVMLSLNGTQLRSFDAVLMLGCDSEHLPSQPEETLFFANAVRRECGLATRESRQRQQLRDFAALLCANGEVVLSWQTQRNGEPNPVSPWIERLQLTLQRAGAPALPQHGVRIALRELSGSAAQMPAPAAPHLVPLRLSASSYNSLVACPYQFFATRMLGLSGLEELTDLPEKRDYGDWLHRILTRYHESLRDDQIAPERREGTLRRITAEVFDTEAGDNAAALGYYVRWQKVLPAYLAWANQREADGWHFVFGEKKFEKQLHSDAGGITLYGRIDRIDENDTGTRAVLDYKTRNVSALRDKLKQGEDRQLAFYGVLSDLPVAHALYVPLEATKDRIADVEAPNFEEATRLLEAHVGTSIRQLKQAAPLPANGIEAVCTYCAVRGLCRKGAW